MSKGFVHNLASTLPERQERAEKRYKQEALQFYGKMEEDGINTSASNVKSIEPTPLIGQLARQILSFSKGKKRWQG